MKKLTNLRDVRERVALSQRELADEVGLTANGYGRIERLEVRPHPKTVRALAEALGVQPEELWAVPLAPPTARREVAELELYRKARELREDLEESERDHPGIVAKVMAEAFGDYSGLVAKSAAEMEAIRKREAKDAS